MSVNSDSFLLPDVAPEPRPLSVFLKPKAFSGLFNKAAALWLLNGQHVLTMSFSVRNDRNVSGTASHRQSPLRLLPTGFQALKNLAISLKPAAGSALKAAQWMRQLPARVSGD